MRLQPATERILEGLIWYRSIQATGTPAEIREAGGLWMKDDAVALKVLASRSRSAWATQATSPRPDRAAIDRTLRAAGYLSKIEAAEGQKSAQARKLFDAAGTDTAALRRLEALATK